MRFLKQFLDKFSHVPWYGKVCGAAIGYTVYGITGMLIGAYLGHLIDLEETNDGFSRDRRRRSAAAADPLEQKHLAFFICVFSMLAKLAKADGAISASEINVVENFMISDLGLDPQRQKFAKNIFRGARVSKTSFEDHAKEFHRKFKNDRAVLENLLDILIRLSTADGSLVREESVLISRAAQIFGIPEPDLRRLQSRHENKPDRAYAILGCSKKSTNEEIKKAYRKLAMEAHPDRLRSQGQPEEFNRVASEKFRAIQEAYEAVKAERGFS